MIDFSDPTLVCNQFPPLPIPQTACTAGALDGTLPLVCCLTSCYTFQGGQWNAGIFLAIFSVENKPSKIMFFMLAF